MLWVEGLALGRLGSSPETSGPLQTLKEWNSQQEIVAFWGTVAGDHRQLEGCQNLWENHPFSIPVDLLFSFHLQCVCVFVFSFFEKQGFSGFSEAFHQGPHIFELRSESYGPCQADQAQGS